MRTIILAVWLSVVYCNVLAQGYIIKLSLENVSDSRIVLSYTDKGKKISDTSTRRMGNIIEFKGIVTEPTLVYLTNINPKLGLQLGSKAFLNSPDFAFLLTNETILIKGNAEKIYLSTVVGGQANNEWNIINPQLMELEDKNWGGLKNAYAMLAKGDSAALKSYRMERGKISSKKDSIEVSFIKNHPRSIVSMMLLAIKSTSMPIDQLEGAYVKLSKEHKTTVWGKTINDKIKAAKAVSVGKMAENFTKNKVNGDQISLHSLRGKIVLLRGF